MKIGIGIPNQIRDVRADVIPEWARRAEHAGFAFPGQCGPCRLPGGDGHSRAGSGGRCHEPYRAHQ